MRRRLLGAAAVVACIAGVPAGFAVGQALDEETPAPKGPHKEASACPAAEKLLASYGLETDYFVPNCPSKEDLRLMEPDLVQSPGFIEACEEERARDELSEACAMLLEEQERIKDARRAYRAEVAE